MPRISLKGFGFIIDLFLAFEVAVIIFFKHYLLIHGLLKCLKGLSMTIPILQVEKESLFYGFNRICEL